MRDSDVGRGRARQDRIYRDGITGKRPAVPTDGSALAAAAAKVLEPRAYAYLAGSAGRESTEAANRAAFERFRIVPRVLRNVANRDLSVEIFGDVLPAPVLLAPIGVLSLAHEEADLAVARAAASSGVPFVFSNQASVPMEETARAMGNTPHWFQMYWSTEEALVDSFIARAEATRARALVVTLDTTMLGWRPRDLDLGSLPFAQGEGIAQYTSDPVFQHIVGASPPSAVPRPKITRSTLRTRRNMFQHHADPAAVQTFLRIYSRPSLTWDDVAGLRDRTRLPIVLKGILHPDDARRALDAGVDGIVVSTHGGRQVDGSIGSLDALPPVLKAVDGAVPVLVDSGVRSGADVFKAIALGARSVLLGRPYAYGLALAGEQGVREVIENLLAELDLTLGLSGLTSLAELGPDALALSGSPKTLS